MAFQVFPNEAGNQHQQPLSIPAGASASKPLGTLPASGFNYVAISVAGIVVQPQFFLTAGTGATKGTEQPIPIDSAFHSVFLADNSDAGDVKVDPAVGGVYLMTFFLSQATAWQLRMLNNDAAARNFVWVLADTQPESQQPWINAAPTGSYDVFAGAVQTVAIAVQNFGTGPANLVAGAAPGPGFSIPVVPAPIPPNGNDVISIDYTGTAAAGEVTAIYTVTASPPDTAFPVPLTPQHNNQIKLTADTGLIEAVFLVDASGSMAYTPDGGTPAAPDEARWAKLKAGAQQSWAVLAGFAAGNGNLALAEFPDITTGSFPAPSPSSKVLLPASEISVANITAAQTALDAHTPVQNGGATPIGHGLSAAMGSVPGNFGLFQSTPNAMKFNERFLILQSDGASNSTPPDPQFFYPPGDMGEAAGNFFTDKKIKVIAVGYGKQGTPFEVDDGLLMDLATNSVGGGYFLDAFADDSGQALAKQLRQAVVDGLHLDLMVDPTGVLTSNNSEARYEIPVLPYDTKVGFSVDWVTRDAPISVTIVTPLCESITEQSAPKTAGVFFSTGPFHRLFVFDKAFLSNQAAPAQPRYGNWKLIIDYSPFQLETATAARASVAAASEQYQYEVITESRLKLDVTFDKPRYGTGDTIGISAKLTLDGQGISNASVMLNATLPGQSSDNFIAFTPVPAALLERAQGILSHEDVTAVGIKSFAIKLKGVEFNAFSNTRNIPMIEDGHTGVYKASISSTSVPGSYQFYVTAVGLAGKGVAFRRERPATQRVEVIPIADFTLVDILYQPGKAIVTVSPRDSFGNVFRLFDPAFNPLITLSATGGGEFQKGPLTFNGDGSYTGAITYPPTAHPIIKVSVGGTVVIPGFPLQPVTEMIWADQVVDFHAGAEGSPGINTHKDPSAALGDPLTKAPGLFVALGGRGTLTLGFKGKVIANAGGADVTVFVEPTAGLRPYRVEASTGANQWVTLGTSSGITQSFSLGALPSAQAIRITDLSGAIRDGDHVALITPGINIRALGAKSTSADTGGRGGGGGGKGDICLRLQVVNPQHQPLGGKVGIEFQPQEAGPVVKVENVDASGEIDISGLQRTPVGLYQVTVIPTDVFVVSSQFVTIPASGFATATFVIDKTKT